MLKKLFFKKLLIIDTNIIDYILKLKSTQDSLRSLRLDFELKSCVTLYKIGIVFEDKKCFLLS